MNESANCSKSEVLLMFTESYDTIHGPLCIFICIAGFIANVLNIIVLNQPSMRSPTNVQLTFLALSDATIMAFYIVFDAKFLMQDQLSGSHKAWAWYLYFHNTFQNILHSFSSWVIVTLAVFRLVYIRFPHQATEICTFKRARLAMILVLLASICLTIPYHLGHKVKKSHLKTKSGEDLWTIDYVQSDSLQNLMFWTTGILIKLLPIVLLTLLSLLLILAMQASEKRRRKLKGIGKSGGCREEDENASRTVKTTRMLLCVVFIFMVTYFPQSLVLILNVFLGDCFSKHVYDPLGNLMDLLTLINNGINFILYCTMSKQFRDTFIHLFVSKWRERINQSVLETFPRKQRNCQSDANGADIRNAVSQLPTKNEDESLVPLVHNNCDKTQNNNLQEVRIELTNL